VRCDVAYFNLFVGPYVNIKGWNTIRNILCEMWGLRFGTDEDSGVVGCTVLTTDCENVDGTVSDIASYA